MKLKDIKDKVIRLLQRIRAWLFGTKGKQQTSGSASGGSGSVVVREEGSPSSGSQQPSEHISVEDLAAIKNAMQEGYPPIIQFANYVVEGETEEQQIKRAIEASKQNLPKQPKIGLAADPNVVNKNDLLSKKIDSMFVQGKVEPKNVSPATLHAISNDIVGMCNAVKAKADDYSFGDALKKTNDGTAFVAVKDYNRIIEKLEMFKKSLEQVATTKGVDSNSILKLNPVLESLNRNISELSMLRDALHISTTKPIKTNRPN